jgi:hypothetical protein
VLIWVGLAALVIAGVAVLLPMKGPAPPPPTQWSPSEIWAVTSRVEFRQAVLGKREDEVFRRFHQPARVTVDGPRSRWHYLRATTRPDGSALDAEAIVTFERGVATAVEIIDADGTVVP